MAMQRYTYARDDRTYIWQLASEHIYLFTHFCNQGAIIQSSAHTFISAWLALISLLRKIGSIDFIQFQKYNSFNDLFHVHTYK